MTAGGSLTDLVHSYLDLRWHMDPVQASFEGLSQHDGRLGSFSEACIHQHIAALKAISASVEEQHPDSLDDEIDRTALLGEIRSTLYRLEHERPHRRNPALWLSHVLEGLYVLLVVEDRSKESLQRSTRERLRAIPGVLDDARATLRQCPPVFVDTAQRVGDAGLELISLVAAAHLQDNGQEGSDGVQQSASEALTRFIAWLPEVADDESSFAIGEAAFNFRLQFQHALRDTAPQLWRYGESLISQVEAELTALARHIDRATPWPDLVDRLRDDHPTADQLVDVYAGEMERARIFVAERDLAPLPEGDLTVVPTPGFLQPLIPFAAYQAPGVFSSNRRGRFYVTQPHETDPAATARALRDHCTHEIPSTALHEGYPGHHLHLLIAQEQTSLVRRLVGTPLTIEGWALYCEDMMGEEGFYETAEQKLFQQLALLWRAVRIVLDVGLHTRAMTPAEAVQMLVQHVHFQRGHAEAEVRRYCAEPAYQLCYAVGRRELRSLREAYRNAMGADFRLGDFHRAVLRFGALPVSLMWWGLQLDA